MDVLQGADQDESRLQPSRHFMAALIKRCRWLPCAPVDLSDEEQAAEGVPAVLAVWSGDAQVRSVGIALSGVTARAALPAALRPFKCASSSAGRTNATRTAELHAGRGRHCAASGHQ